MAGGPQDPNLVLMGRIGAAHGIKGEVRITSFTEDPADIAAYGPLATSRPGFEATITHARLAKTVVIARIKGIEDRAAAEKLNGVDLFVPRERLPPPGEDEFYHADLIGLEARNADGRILGRVASIPNYGAGDLIEIDSAEDGLLIFPFTRQVVPEIHLTRGYLVVHPPAEVEADEGHSEP
jgi:16S rRNA processing protein RimM